MDLKHIIEINYPNTSQEFVKKMTRLLKTYILIELVEHIDPKDIADINSLEKEIHEMGHTDFLNFVSHIFGADEETVSLLVTKFLKEYKYE